MLDIAILGQFSLSVDGQPIGGPITDRLQSLLAYLLLHANAPQSRVHLAFLFWPDMPEPNGRNNLRQVIHQLRRVLPDADRYLRSDANTIQWVADSARSDVALFDAAYAAAERAKKAGDPSLQRIWLEKALDLCQGPMLPSCFDEWIIQARERVVRQCELAAAALVALLEELRDYANAMARVRHWLQHDPFDEEAHRWLMRLLALSGDRAGALHAYRQCAEVLRREFGTEPSAATVRAFERLRNAELAPSIPAGRRDELPAAPSLVGRQSEWMRLRKSWEHATEGHPSFVVVTGDAGIGKSRLAEELAAWTQRQGVVVAKTRSYAAEGQLSLAPVSEWLRSDALSPYTARLDDVWRVEVARLLPTLLLESDLPRPAPLLQFGDRLRFFEGIARAVLAAPPPLLLVIDDLQWCDRETIEWLHFLSRFDPQAPILVLGTARSEVLDPAHPLPTLLRHLRSASQLVEIALEPLDAAETAALATEIGHRDFDAETATRLYHETEGNPLFVVETMRAEVRGETFSSTQGPETCGLPPRAHAVISGRLAQLSDDARSVVAVAAVIGRSFDVGFLMRLVGGEELVMSALDELWRKRVIREQGPNTYDFTHDKLRDVAYGETSVPQRRVLHRRVAESLVAIHKQNLQPVGAQIAAHYENGGLLEQAIPHYLGASLVAQGLYAHEDTIALAQRGLALLSHLPTSTQRDGWELQLRIVLAPSYRVIKGWAAPELGEELARSLALCDNVGTASQRVIILYGMQSMYLVAGQLEKAALITDELVQLLRQTEGDEPPWAAFAMLAGLRILMGRFEEGRSEIEALVARGEPSHQQHLHHLEQSQGLNYEVHARAWQSHALWCLGHPDTAFERAHLALQMAQQLAQPFSQAIAATYLALLQQLRADSVTFRRQAEEALELATEFKATYYRAWCTILIAYAGTLECPEAARVAHLENAIERFKVTGARLRLPYYSALLAEAHLRANQAAAGLAIVQEALSRSRETNERWWDSELHRLRAELLRVSGAKASETEAALRQAIEIARTQRARSLELRATLALARQWAAIGRAQDARELLEPLYTGFTEGLGTPDLIGASALLVTLH